MVRIFNSTDLPVEQQILMGGKPYKLVRVGGQVEGWSARAGDIYFRKLTVKERDEVAEIMVKAERKRCKQGGRREPNTAKLRAEMRVLNHNRLIVDQAFSALRKA